MTIASAPNTVDSTPVVTESQRNGSVPGFRLPLAALFEDDAE